MSDFLQRDMVPELWEEILELQYSFLETEESLKKLEQRKKLEGCIRELLSVVVHERKFYLPETADILRKSVLEMEDFSAYKAIMGFDAISQYANNLYTKPWRREFRVLRMYSGFFQHEVSSNLLDAEKLFEAMGYRRLSPETLILDGPICPDQVMNVSRDAMTAYVECQIMKNIYSDLLSRGIRCGWKDIFHYREKHTGGASQTSKSLVYVLQDHGIDKEKLSADTLYAVPKPMGSIVTQCENCAPYHMTQPHHMQGLQQNCNQSASHNIYAVPANQLNYMCVKNTLNNGINNKVILPYAIGDYLLQAAHMSHSRSFEHYNEPHAQLPHRHSFDQQQQGCPTYLYQQPNYAQPSFPQPVDEPTYDHLDGVSVDSSASYAAVLDPAANYNVSGNRYPLPYNISNQLNSTYSAPWNGGEAMYATVSKPSQNSRQYNIQPPVVPTRRNQIAAKGFPALRQYSFPPEQLIDFDDRAPLTAHDYNARHAITQTNSFENECYEQPRSRRTRGRGNIQPTYTHPKDAVYQHPSERVRMEAELYDSSGYSRPLQRGHRGKGPNSSTDRYLKNSNLNQDSIDNKYKMHKELKEHASAYNKRHTLPYTQEHEASDLSYDSMMDDFVKLNVPAENSQQSPTQATKNADGVGSFGIWDFVYHTLEKSGHSKDIEDRGNLLMESLDLEANNLLNGTGSTNNDKRRSQQADLKTMRQQNGAKMRTLEKDRILPEKRDNKSNEKQERPAYKQKVSNKGAIAKNPKSAIKNTVENRNDAVALPKSGTEKFNGNNNGNGKDNTTSMRERNTSTSKLTTTKTTTPMNRRSTTKNSSEYARSSSTTAPTASEWSCEHCTFLNPVNKRICEICSKSKDFNEAVVSNTPTCV